VKSPGVFVAIVGPSGAGKDSLIRGLSERLTARDGVLIARRVVTLPSDAHEEHDTLDEAAFANAEKAGRFALSWSAHGLRYGVPVAIDCAIDEGEIVVCNISRKAVAAVRRRYSRSRVVLVTARPEILAARLVARGREGNEGRRERLERAGASEAAVEPDVVVDNNALLDSAVGQLLKQILSWRVSFSE
jgi:ribose 1,5-bisphosphokinase